MDLKVDLVGVEKVREMLTRIGETSAQLALARTVVESEDYVEQEVAKHEGKERRTGDQRTTPGSMFRSIYKRQIRPLSWEIGHDQQISPHVVFVHWGTRPHKIRPKDKKALRW